MITVIPTGTDFHQGGLAPSFSGAPLPGERSAPRG